MAGFCTSNFNEVKTLQFYEGEYLLFKYLLLQIIESIVRTLLNSLNNAEFEKNEEILKFCNHQLKVIDQVWFAGFEKAIYMLCRNLGFYRNLRFDGFSIES